MTKEYKQGKVTPQRIAEAALKYDAAPRKGEEPALSTISSKNQITLPVHLLRQLGLGAGDRLAVSLEDGRMVLRARPKDWPAYYKGSLAGLYGNTREDADEHIRELRDDGRQRDARIEEAWNGQ